MLALPERASFTRDILPLFERLTGLQWVNAGFAARSAGAPRATSLDAEYLARLAQPRADEHEELRQQIFARVPRLPSATASRRCPGRGSTATR